MANTYFAIDAANDELDTYTVENNALKALHPLTNEAVKGTIDVEGWHQAGAAVLVRGVTTQVGRHNHYLDIALLNLADPSTPLYGTTPNFGVATSTDKIDIRFQLNRIRFSRGLTRLNDGSLTGTASFIAERSTDFYVGQVLPSATTKTTGIRSVSYETLLGLGRVPLASTAWNDWAFFLCRRDTGSGYRWSIVVRNIKTLQPPAPNFDDERLIAETPNTNYPASWPRTTRFVYDGGNLVVTNGSTIAWYTWPILAAS